MWIGDGAARVVAIPILTPFPDIAFHVIQSPGVGQLQTDRVRRDAIVRAEPRIIAQVGEIGIDAVIKSVRVARARGTFPLGFGRQPIMITR